MRAAEAGIMTIAPTRLEAGRRLAPIVLVALVLAAGCASDDTATRTSTPNATDRATTTTPNTTVATTAPPPTATTPVPSTVPSSTVGTTVATMQPNGLPADGWQQSDVSILPWANEVIRFADQFVAVGSATGSAGDRSGIWQSSDGVNWDERLMFTRRLPDDPRVWATDVAVAGDAITMIAGRGTGDVKEVVAFRSPDGGITWSETIVQRWDQPNSQDLPAPSFAYGDADVVYTPTDDVVVAAEPTDPREITGPMVWISDGHGGWDDVDPADSGLVGWVNAIAATPDGYVAVGTARSRVDCVTQALWRSPDAVTWTKVWHDDEPCRWYESGELFELGNELYFAGASNTVVTCGNGDCTPFEPELDLLRIIGDTIEDVVIEPFEASRMLLSDVTVHDGTLIIVGSVGDDAFGGGQLRIWLSDDAHNWYAAEIPADGQIVPMGAQVAATDDRIIVLATEFTQHGWGYTHIWVRESGEG